MRGMSQIMILCWRSPLQRKSCFAIAFRAKAAACAPVCRFSLGSDIHSRMIARRAACSGLISRLFSGLSLWRHARCRTSASSIAPIPQGEDLISELKPAIFLPAAGDSSVFRAPLRAGAAHIVRLGPVPVRRIADCGPPRRCHSRTRLHNREGENTHQIGELLIHPKSPIGRQCIDQGIRIRGGTLLVVIYAKYGRST
jgi:hypothetical protein